MRRLFPGRAMAAAVAGLLLAGLSHTAAFSAVGAVPQGTFKAELETPHTSYIASFASDPENPLTFSWEGSEVECGSWQPGTATTHDPSSATATWFHGTGSGALANNTGVECAHEGGTDAQSHAGTFRVKVKDAAGNVVTCTRSGSGDGEGTCAANAVVADARCPQPGTVRAQSLTVPNVICGTDGDDELVGTLGVDLIIGGGGNDAIRGGGGQDTIEAGDGDDVIDAADVPSPIDGPGTDDRLDAGSGSDRVFAGTGDDVVTLLGDGTDVVVAGGGNDVVGIGEPAQPGASRPVLKGGAGNDRMTGSSVAEQMLGESGNDRLSGGRGRDVLNGGKGTDRCSGGPAKDRERGCEK